MLTHAWVCSCRGYCRLAAALVTHARWAHEHRAAQATASALGLQKDWFERMIVFVWGVYRLECAYCWDAEFEGGAAGKDGGKPACWYSGHVDTWMPCFAESA
jgi:hypothetical protein